ncbi:hypothetical protein PVAP13_1NG475314 [Panicum virgatum]|uniref:THO complex subunit 5B n=1 Tax=Panicum virgatum TaxID=38727 RepID=A0A8T0X5Y7_PANVG|nr:hypothetical protein PVAP13_1NG475314 [Panicum virgatum]
MAAAPKAEAMDTRASIEKVAARMLAIKRDGVPKSELRELVTQMSLLLVTLRQVNREILMEEDRVKAEEAAKAPVDSTTLQLHNLLYEKNHYVKAIRACLDFQTKYPGIELVPEEEFQRARPADIRDKTLAADASHDLMLKRLNFELVQRKELCKLHEKLELQRSSLLETIATSLPVQQQLGMQHTKKLKQHHAAELLPTPLYSIHSVVRAKEAFGENIEVEIMGSTKDAKIFAQQQAKKENAGTLSNGDHNRMDDDVIDDEEDAQRRRSRSKKNVMKEANNPAMAYQLHPLKLIVHVEYLAKLNVVCVGIEESEGLDNNILCNLFPDDTGLELPHQPPNFTDKNSRPYKWAQHLAGIDFLPEVPPSVGDDSNRALSSSDLSSGLALYRQQNRAQTILQRESVRGKVAQMALMWQLDYLTKLKWPRIEHKNTPWASRTHCSFPQPLSRSSLMVNEAASSVDKTESIREDGELPVVIHAENKTNSSAILPSEMSPELNISHSFGRNEDDLDLLMYSDSELEDQPFIQEETQKGNLIIDKSWEDYASKEFTCMEYPLRPPLFRLRLLSEKSETLKWHNDLRAMETEVNLHILRSLPWSCEDYILTHQVMCLAMLFDMHFDEDYEKRKVTSVIDVGLCKPVSGTMLTRSVRGRDRRQTIYWRGC